MSTAPLPTVNERGRTGALMRTRLFTGRTKATIYLSGKQKQLQVDFFFSSRYSQRRYVDTR